MYQACAPGVCQLVPGAGISPPRMAQCCCPAGGSVAWSATAHIPFPVLASPPGFCGWKCLFCCPAQGLLFLSQQGLEAWGWQGPLPDPFGQGRSRQRGRTVAPAPPYWGPCRGPVLRRKDGSNDGSCSSDWGPELSYCCSLSLRNLVCGYSGCVDGLSCCHWIVICWLRCHLLHRTPAPLQASGWTGWE